MEKYILALDQGTSSSRAILFNDRGQPFAIEDSTVHADLPKAGMGRTEPRGDLEFAVDGGPGRDPEGPDCS